MQNAPEQHIVPTWKKWAAAGAAAVAFTSVGAIIWERIDDKKTVCGGTQELVIREGEGLIAAAQRAGLNPKGEYDNQTITDTTLEMNSDQINRAGEERSGMLLRFPGKCALKGELEQGVVNIE